MFSSWWLPNTNKDFHPSFILWRGDWILGHHFCQKQILNLATKKISAREPLNLTFHLENLIEYKITLFFTG